MKSCKSSLVIYLHILLRYHFSETCSVYMTVNINQLSNTSTVRTFNSETITSCAKKCCKHPVCQSYFYNNIGGMCQLVDGVLATFSQTEYGWIYLKQMDPFIKCHPHVALPTTYDVTTPVISMTEDTTQRLTNPTSTNKQTTTQSVTCGNSWIQYGLSCYKLFTSLWKDWYQAKTYCEDLGGYLPEIKTSRQNEFVIAQLDQHNAAWIWLGGGDYVEEGTFVWEASQEQLTFSDFAIDEPNNTGNEDYLAISDNTGEHKRKWYDVAETPNKNVLCEKPAT